MTKAVDKWTALMVAKIIDKNVYIWKANTKSNNKKELKGLVF